MNKLPLLHQLKPLFADVFNNPSIEVDETTSAKDISDWDSLNHAILIDKIEKKFEVKFSLLDMIQMKNAGDICERLQAISAKE